MDIIEKKRRLQKIVCEIYQDISEEEKNKKQQYARKWYKHLSEEEKLKNPQYGRERYIKSSWIWKTKASWV